MTNSIRVSDFERDTGYKVDVTHLPEGAVNALHLTEPGESTAWRYAGYGIKITNPEA